MAGEVGVGEWAAEFARAGVVRICPRRRVVAVRMLFPTFLLVNYLIVIVLALLGRKDWLWFPLFCVVTAPTFVATIWPQARMLLRGHPVLVVDALGVSLGRERLGWDEIRVVEGPGSVRRRSADPRRPVRADLEWFDVVTVASGTERKGPRISVGKEHVGDLEGLAAWLQGVRDGQRAW